jgi:hypothetical protein
MLPMCSVYGMTVKSAVFSYENGILIVGLIIAIYLHASNCSKGCVQKRRLVRSDRSDRRNTPSVHGRNVGGVWPDSTHSIRKYVGTAGNFDRSPNSDRSIFISIDVNKHSRRSPTDLEKDLQHLETPHHWQQTFGNAPNNQIDPTRISERSACSTPFCTDRSDSTSRTHPQCRLMPWRHLCADD